MSGASFSGGRAIIKIDEMPREKVAAIVKAGDRKMLGRGGGETSRTVSTAVCDFPDVDPQPGMLRLCFILRGRTKNFIRNQVISF